MKLSIKIKIHNLSIMEKIILIVLIIEVGALCIFNLTRLTHQVDYDSSAAFAQAIEVWNQKTLFIKNWDYQSTLGLDSLLPLASLFYGITGNIFVAYGIAECFGLALYIYLFIDLGKRIQLKIGTTLLLCCMVLIPYSAGQLGYITMMFSGAAYYIIKVVIPILFIDILLRIRDIDKNKYTLALLILFFIFLFFTGFSCGIYLLICGIFPVAAYAIWHSPTKNNIVLSICSITLILIGNTCGKLYAGGSFVNTMVLCTWSSFFDNMRRWFLGMFELFGAITHNKVTITSPQGIYLLLHIGMTIIIVGGIILGLYFWAFKHKCMDTTYHFALGCFASVVGINIIVLLLTNTTYGSSTYEYRYHLIPLICGFFLFGYALDHIIIKYKTFVFSMLVCICSATAFSSIGTYYATTHNTLDSCNQLMNLINNEEITIAYFIGESTQTEIEARISRLSGYDINIIYGASYGEFHGWGTSTEYMDISKIESNPSTAYIFSKNAYESLDSTIKSRLNYMFEFNGYSIYMQACMTSPTFE